MDNFPERLSFSRKIFSELTELFCFFAIIFNVCLITTDTFSELCKFGKFACHKFAAELGQVHYLVPEVQGTMEMMI